MSFLNDRSTIFLDALLGYSLTTCIIEKKSEKTFMPQTEAFTRTLIDAKLKGQDWKTSDGISVRYS